MSALCDELDGSAKAPDEPRGQLEKRHLAYDVCQKHDRRKQVGMSHLPTN